MGESDLDFGRTLSDRARRRWFVYLMMSIFYCLDIFLTLLVLGSGQTEESNPVSAFVLGISGPGGWIAFRIAVLVMTSFALLVTFTLASIALARAGRDGAVDKIEEVAIGAVLLFYAITIVHNLVSIMGQLPHLT